MTSPCGLARSVSGMRDSRKAFIGMVMLKNFVYGLKARTTLYSILLANYSRDHGHRPIAFCLRPSMSHLLLCFVFRLSNIFETRKEDLTQFVVTFQQTELVGE